MTRPAYAAAMMFLISSVFISRGANEAVAGPKYRCAIFLHHSVGDVIYHGSYENTAVPTTVPLEIARYNSAHGYTGTSAVSMDEPATRLFPSPNISENDWWYWQQILAGCAVESATFNGFLATYPVIILKTCYLSEEFMRSADSVEVYKSHYRAVVRYMSQHTNFFVIWNNYPAYYTGTDNQLRSCAFSRWVKDTLAAGRDATFGGFPTNVYVFDVFRKIANPITGAEPLQYIIGGGDEHPSNAAVAVVTPPFVTEVFDAALAYENQPLAVTWGAPPTLTLEPGNIVKLAWTTLSETGTYRFYAERKSTEWQTIDSVAGGGTTAAGRKYAVLDSLVVPGTWSYRIRQVDLDGSTYYSEAVSTTIASATVRGPADFALEQNYPNPFNPGTTFRYALPRAAHVTLTLYNPLGQQVAVILDADQGAGVHEFRFAAGGLASGVYYCRMNAEKFNGTMRLLLVR